MSVLVKFLVIPMPHVPTRQAATHVSVPWAFLEMAQHVKVSETIAKIKVLLQHYNYYALWNWDVLLLIKRALILAELEAVEEEQRSRGSANVILAAILAVLGALLAISVIIIAAVCIVRWTKPAAIYRKKQNMGSGFSKLYHPPIYLLCTCFIVGNAVYSNTASGSVQLYSINTGVYDYPTLASTDTKPPVYSHHTCVVLSYFNVLRVNLLCSIVCDGLYKSMLCSISGLNVHILQVCLLLCVWLCFRCGLLRLLSSTPRQSTVR